MSTLANNPSGPQAPVVPAIPPAQPDRRSCDWLFEAGTWTPIDSGDFLDYESHRWITDDALVAAGFARPLDDDLIDDPVQIWQGDHHAPYEAAVMFSVDDSKVFSIFTPTLPDLVELLQKLAPMRIARAIGWTNYELERIAGDHRHGTLHAGRHRR